MKVIPFILALLVIASQALAELECPEPARLQGSAPPEGLELQCVLPDGRRHGPYKHWYSNGQLMEWLHFKDGKEHGEQQAWWPNGQLMMRGESINGKRYKAFEYWDMLGQPRELTVEIIEEIVEQ